MKTGHRIKEMTVINEVLQPVLRQESPFVVNATQAASPDLQNVEDLFESNDGSDNQIEDKPVR